jgi:hypothetical protein
MKEQPSDAWEIVRSIYGMYRGESTGYSFAKSKSAYWLTPDAIEFEQRYRQSLNTSYFTKQTVRICRHYDWKKKSVNPVNPFSQAYKMARLMNERLRHNKPHIFGWSNTDG